MPTLYSIGHSTHPLKDFLCLIKKYDIEVLADVRSSPYSRFAPQFNQVELKRDLRTEGIRYLFIGDQLGGRPTDETFYDKQGHVKYWLVAKSPFFVEGIRRLENGITRYRIAIMCSEENPLDCHRSLLIGRVMAGNGTDVLHIRAGGSILSEEDITRLYPPQTHFFAEAENSWRSIQSVLQRRPPKNSLKRSSEQR